MKKIIENDRMNDHDCQGVLAVLFASLVTTLDRDIPEGMAPCGEDGRKTGKPGEPCTHCGGCRTGPKTLRKEAVGAYAGEYSFVSGEVFLLMDLAPVGKSNDVFADQYFFRYYSDKLDLLDLRTQMDDHIGFLFGYAGYAYESMKKGEGKEAIYSRVKASIEAGVPVIMKFAPQISNAYALITGYDDGGMALYACDGTNDGSYLRAGWTADWYERLDRAYIPGEKCGPTATIEDAFARGAMIMKPIFEGGIYKKAIEYVKDNKNYRKSRGNLAFQARLIHHFIEVPICGRSAACWFSGGACERYEKYRKEFGQIAVWGSEFHNQCWVVWRAAGKYTDHKAAKIRRLADPYYRRVIAEVLEICETSDRWIYNALCDACRVAGK